MHVTSLGWQTLTIRESFHPAKKLNGKVMCGILTGSAGTWNWLTPDRAEVWWVSLVNKCSQSDAVIKTENMVLDSSRRGEVGLGLQNKSSTTALLLILQPSGFWKIWVGAGKSFRNYLRLGKKIWITMRIFKELNLLPSSRNMKSWHNYIMQVPTWGRDFWHKIVLNQ